MKKIITVLLILITLLSASGCSKIVPASDPEPVSSSSVIEEPSLPVSSSVPEKSEPEPEPETEEPVVIKHITRKGDQGEEVEKLQLALLELGYFAGDIDGIFEDNTESALKEFQSFNSLIVSGILDSKTENLLYEGTPVSKKDLLPLSGLIIGIDPGHQKKGNNELEPNAPGSDVMKKKVSYGTAGIVTRTEEWRVNLNVSLMLRELLEAKGATVVMTHDIAEVDISNSERAKIFNENKTDYAVRIHCNGAQDTTQHGAFVVIPKSHPHKEEATKAANIMIEEFCKTTGADKRKNYYSGTTTGFNWCERMIFTIEMGYMSNPEEDRKLADPEYQKKMAEGLLNGILKYYEDKNGSST